MTSLKLQQLILPLLFFGGMDRSPQAEAFVRKETVYGLAYYLSFGWVVAGGVYCFGAMVLAKDIYSVDKYNRTKKTLDTIDRKLPEIPWCYFNTYFKNMCAGFFFLFIGPALTYASIDLIDSYRRS